MINERLGNSVRVVRYKNDIIRRVKNLNPLLASDLDQILSGKLPWYIIKNEAEDNTNDTTQVFIYDEIGGSLGVNANDFVQELEQITTPNIEVRINSPGGSVFDSIAIRNALVKHSSNIITYVDALAASGASIIALGGDEIVMMPGSQLMIHDALGMEMGNAAQFREMADFLDRQSDNIASIYAGKAGGEIAEWRARMLAETWFFDTEAVEIGLANKVYEPAKQEVDPEEMPDEPEEGEEKNEEGEEEEDTEIEIENLMKAIHPLNRFKYAGRAKAPNPNISNSFDSLINSIPLIGR